MKNVAVLCVIMMLVSITALSQVNCNPDPNGPQWLAGGIPDSISSEQQQIIDSIPEMILDPLNYSIPLPAFVHNHEKIYMPPIMDQDPQLMCSQASIVYYVFTYEINRLRGGHAEISSNRFHPSFTYNFLNGGTGSGLTHITSGIEILKEMGCPDEDTYNTAVGYVGVPTVDPTEWMSGYGNYRKSLVNRVTQEEKIDISTSLTDLKHWLYNHGDPESNDNGGIGSVVFENMYGVQWSAFDPNDPYSKLYISGVIETDTNDAHVMTIVGYDDALQCGNYTGALILANSWGEYQPISYNAGYEYLPYALINADYMLLKDGDSIWVYVIHVATDYQPKFILEAEISHPKRDSLWLAVGAHNLSGQSIPYDSYVYKTFKGKAGKLPLLGLDNYTPMEVALDFEYYLNSHTPPIPHDSVVGFFLSGYQPNFNVLDGEILNYRLIDNRCENPHTINSTATFPIPLSNVWHNWTSIDYIRLPENITEDMSITENQVCHCQTVISDGATLTIPSHKQLNFHHGQISVDPASTMEFIGSDAIGKSGQNKIVVEGDLLIGNSVTFLNESPLLSSFTIDYQNDQVNTINQGNFHNLTIKASGGTLNVDGAQGGLTIEDTRIDFSGGNLNINNLNATNTNIKAYLPQSENSSITIQSSQFTNGQNCKERAVISIDDYKVFTIQGCSINYSRDNGIVLSHAGKLSTGNTLIYDNTIKCTLADNQDTRGVSLFFSAAELKKNIIEDNDFGVVSFGRSDPIIMGNESEDYNQFINNNIHGFFSCTSYPSEFHYNIFSKDVNDENPYVEVVNYDIIENDTVVPDNPGITYDITCNSWNDQFFDPLVDLVPEGSFVYEPFWSPGNTCSNNFSGSNELYTQAVVYAEDSSYSEADSLYKEVVSTYPDSYEAISSLKDLYYLEEQYNNDYVALQNYYQSVIDSDQDSLLCQLANWLKMHCDIKLENYQIAINWLDSVISNPGCPMDSIFALINQGYIFTHLPDSSNRVIYLTRYPENIPASLTAYQDRREQLIKELLKSQKRKEITPMEEMDNYQNRSANILSIKPNPSSSFFTLDFGIYKRGNIKIDLYSIHGKKISSSDYGMFNAGKYSQTIANNFIKPGIYLVVLKYNDISIDQKKVIVQ